MMFPHSAFIFGVRHSIWCNIKEELNLQKKFRDDLQCCVVFSSAGVYSDITIMINFCKSKYTPVLASYIAASGEFEVKD